MTWWLSLASIVAAAAAATPTATDLSDQLRQVGASVPFTHYEAEDVRGNGTPIGPDRRAGTLAAEASGRRAIRLDRPGQSIEFVLAASANALTIRYSIPDSADGQGVSGALIVQAGGARLAVVPITSRFSWFYGRYPFSNRPSDGYAHHFWDEVRVLLPRTLPAGSRLNVAQSGGIPEWVAIDVIDAEMAPPPLSAPANALLVTSFGADPKGDRSSRTAFIKAIDVARRSHRPLFIPPGRYRVDGHLEVDRVKIAGAGPWHSVVAGSGIGFYSREGGSTDVSLSNFAIESDVGERRDSSPLAAIGGIFSRSSFSDLFLHRAKVGVWLDGPASGLILRRLRITDMTADGINLHRGISDALVEQNFIRNVGDDGIASWSEKVANSRITIRNNSVLLPLLANGIALYGGRDIVVRDNLVVDTLTQGGGLHLGTRFKSEPFSGAIDLTGNKLVRTGSFDPNWRFGVGAVWLYALEQPIRDANITVRNTLAIDSSCEAVQLLGANAISGVQIENMTATGSGGGFLAVQAPGSITISRAASSGRLGTEIVEVPDNFTLTSDGGNIGWSTVRRPHPRPPECDLGPRSVESYTPASAHASAPPWK